MRADSSTRQRRIAEPARPLSSQRSQRIAVEHLRLGMFVAELDRPWSDTPFLIQGFAIDSAIELSTLRRYCGHVFVDLERSTPESADLARAIGPHDLSVGLLEADTGIGPDTLGAPLAQAPGAGNADAGQEDSPPPPRKTSRTFHARSDVHISRETRRRFRALVKGAATAVEAGTTTESVAGRTFSRIRALLFDDADAADSSARSTPQGLPARLREELVALLPAGERLRAWVARHGAADEMPRARLAFSRAEQALSELAEDLREGRQPQLEHAQVAARHLADSMSENPDALLWVSLRHDEPMLLHQQSLRVGLYMIALTRRLGLPREIMVRAAMVGMLADVGKTRLPRALLEKPGMLNPAEYGIVKEHVRLGLEMLAEGGSLDEDVILGIAQHHERLDGSGYPKGLRDGEIGVLGRMAAIVDSYVGLTTPRAYASPLAPQDALMNLFQWGGSSFDAALVEQFVQAIGAFPVGSLVELSSGEIALVREQRPGRPLHPRVRLLTWPDRRLLAVPLEVDLYALRGDSGPSAPGRVVRGLPSDAIRVSPDPEPAAESGTP